jgi:hypothetical protein
MVPPFGPFRSYEPFPCTILATKGEHMATWAERMRVLRERVRRGLRRFTIGVIKDDLRVIAEHGYEGATGTDHDQRAQALSRFITDMLAARRSARNSVAAVATSFQQRCYWRCNAVVSANFIISGLGCLRQ